MKRWVWFLDPASCSKIVKVQKKPDAFSTERQEATPSPAPQQTIKTVLFTICAITLTTKQWHNNKG